MKVALVHDYLREYGGAEKVVEVLHELFPEAPLFTAYVNFPGLGIHQNKFKSWDIRTSWLQRLPFANRLLSPMRVFAPLMFEGFDLKKYDLVISSSAVYFAKGVITKPEALHISYIHTPPRYLYGFTTAYDFKKNPFIKFAASILNHFLRIYDFESSQRPDILVANSKNTAARIKKFYRRDAEVIYPPVDLSEFRDLPKEKEEYFLSLSRLDRNKRVSTIIEAFNQLNLPLKIVGDGRERESLKKLASGNIEFLGSVRDEERVKLLAGAKALILAAEDEDFGITSVEAQAAGTPVIALRAGGYQETVIEGKTGVFFEKPTPDSLMNAVKNFDPQKFKASDLKKNAQKFSKDRFKKEMLELIEKNVKE